MTDTEPKVSNFIHDIIDQDLANGKHEGVVTRFPPEPNGYLHIGHAKAICINFGTAEKYGGRYHLRFDDTNPIKEDSRYIDAIKADIKWLGFDWEKHLYFASDYFQQLYDYAQDLIRQGKAYVDSLSAEETREYRGSLTEAGKDSPYRNRSIEENLDLFARMKAGEFEEGAHVLRAKIDMASPNMNMRDPTLYRIRKVHHHRTGNDWCIYPMYDYTHCVSDALEGITHSLCSLEFENHRPLYDWVLDQLDVPCHPQQIEFAKLRIRNAVGKRYMVQLVDQKLVSGWDDPRMMSLSGLRRRGYTPTAIRSFADKIGVAKNESTVDFAFLEYCLRQDLNQTATRMMAVMDPIKVVITNYPEGQSEDIEADNNPEDPEAGKRKMPFSRELYIEKTDFMEDPPRKYFRMAPGKEVRLKHAYYITCQEVIKNEAGEVIELQCTYDPLTRGGWSDDGRKVRGTLHWVSVPHALEAEVRLYDHLFKEEYADGATLEESMAENSLEISTAWVEPTLKTAQTGDTFQFLRTGYFCVDPDSTTEKLVFNRTVTMVDSWAKKMRNQAKKK